MKAVKPAAEVPIPPPSSKNSFFPRPPGLRGPPALPSQAREPDKDKEPR
jgi:hypothetical protein